jgi:hypothetical protein
VSPFHGCQAGRTDVGPHLIGENWIVSVGEHWKRLECKFCSCLFGVDQTS